MNAYIIYLNAYLNSKCIVIEICYQSVALKLKVMQIHNTRKKKHTSLSFTLSCYKL